MWISTSFGHGPAVMSCPVFGLLATEIFLFHGLSKVFFWCYKNYERINLDFCLSRNLAKNVHIWSVKWTEICLIRIFFFWGGGFSYCVFFFSTAKCSSKLPAIQVEYMGVEEPYLNFLFLKLLCVKKKYIMKY